MDFLKGQGELAFGSRLRRLVKRTDRDICGIYDELGIGVQARWFPILALLVGSRQLSITEIASALQYSHTAVNKLAREMSRKGLLVSAADAQDGRKRLLRLSKKGRETVLSLQPIWEEIRRVTKDLVNSSNHNVLLAAEAIEKELDKKDVRTRVRERLKPRMLDAVEIVDYHSRYKKHFYALNVEWLEKYFSVEDFDIQILSNPYQEIIKKGGAVFFARRQRRIVGTCALIKHDNDIYELAKMAVNQEYRRRYVGTKLVEAVVEKAKTQGIETLYLDTSPKLVAAMRLYEKMGFQTTEDQPFRRKYRRRPIIMKLNLVKER